MTDLVSQADARWLIAFWVLSVRAGGGLAWTASRLDSHPVAFALSLSWIIVVIVSATTRSLILGIDPKRFRFARWEREGKAHNRIGLSAFRRLLQHTPLGWLNPRIKLTSCRSGMQRLLWEMGYAEGVHLVAGVVTLAFATVYARSA